MFKLNSSASALYPEFLFYQWYINLGISVANMRVIFECLLSFPSLSSAKINFCQLYSLNVSLIYCLFYISAHFLGEAFISSMDYCNSLLTDVFASCLALLYIITPYLIKYELDQWSYLSKIQNLTMSLRITCKNISVSHCLYDEAS